MINMWAHWSLISLMSQIGHSGGVGRSYTEDKLYNTAVYVSDLEIQVERV